MNIICKQQYVREDNEKNMLKNKMTIEHMNLHYGDFHALKDINLNIKENQITAFIGPSGCGKSTLLKSLNRMNDLVEGCKIDVLIRYTYCLLHVMCYHNDGVLGFQFHNKILDLGCGNRIQRRCGLIHQKYLRMNSQSTGNTAPG